MRQPLVLRCPELDDVVVQEGWRHGVITIDSAELQVRHRLTRQSPYVLVLTKTHELFHP
jgi:hypothetical protein